MKEELERINQEYQQLLASQKFDPKDLDYTLVDHHIEKLEMINVMKNGSVSIYDLCRKTHLYISSKYESILGYDTLDFERDYHNHLYDLIHPEDLFLLTSNGMKYMKLGLSWPKEKRNEIKNYKYISDYRIKSRDGEYKRVIEQHILLELDRKGNLWLSLGILDLSPDQDFRTPCRSRLVNTSTGELFQLPAIQFDKNLSQLSLREREVLQLISNGLLSKQIADKLFISVNTVNTHRQRIIEKLNVTNTAQAVQYATTLGLIP